MNRRKRWVWISRILALAPCAIGWAEAGSAVEITPESDPLSEPTRRLLDMANHPQQDTTVGETIPTHIAALASPDFATRIRATDELVVAGPAALHPLRIAFNASIDTEQRLRIERIVRDIYFDHHLERRNAFLGISFQAGTAPVPAADPNRRRFVPAAVISRVIPETAAARAGLQPGDSIVAVDNRELAEVGDGQVVLRLGDLIRARGPDAHVVLSVVRGNVLHRITVRVGRRPWAYYFEGIDAEVAHLQEKLRIAIREYRTFSRRVFDVEFPMAEPDAATAAQITHN